jgi:Glu-tRNA(Gln) amidotransferase subunit E-like FAD-binding protein
MNIQQLRAQIAALQDATMDENKNFRTAYDEGKFDALTAVDNLLDSLQEEPVSDDLEEAANDYAHDLLHDDVFEAFIAGAQWQKGKTLSDVKKAVTGKVFQFSMKNVEARGDDPNGKTVTLEGPVTFHINNPESIIDALIAL